MTAYPKRVRICLSAIIKLTTIITITTNKNISAKLSFAGGSIESKEHELVIKNVDTSDTSVCCERVTAKSKE